MIIVVQAPNEQIYQGIKLFIAGGIRNCPDWQNVLIEKLKNDKRIDKKEVIVIFNPRCNEIPEEIPQVTWEFKRLKQSDIISFWFSSGSVNPITLLEYGKHLKAKRPIIVGCHPDYERKTNVEIQTKLERPRTKINEDFDSFYEEIVKVLINKINNLKK